MVSNPQVFVDFHHASLLKSFILLFEKRLGGKVYRPIGREWWEKGYWKIYDHPATVAQYLDVGGATPDGTQKLNEVESLTVTTNPKVFWYNCHDIEGTETNRAITYEGFMQSNIDIVIASIPAHVESFKRLCASHPNKPKLIYQIGNAWTVEAAIAPNIMASSIVDGVPSNINFISYHQEFDTNIFSPCAKCFISEYHTDWEPHSRKNIFSFVNCFNVQPNFVEDWQFFQRMEQAMPDWNFKSFGGQCRDGSKNGSKELAEGMREAKFIWHVKNGGDGYGHVLHNAAAVGRPVITKMLYYSGKMGMKLLRDGETCINIDMLSIDEIINKINYYSEPSRHAQMCKNVYQNFKHVCDFDVESTLLQSFLDKLQ